MITKELLDYVQGEYGRKVPLSLIKERLVGQGWNAVDVDEATQKLGLTAPVSAPITAPTPAVTATPVQAKPMTTTAPVQAFSSPVAAAPVVAKPATMPEMSKPAQPHVASSATPMATDPFGQLKQPVVASSPTTSPLSTTPLAQPYQPVAQTAPQQPMQSPVRTPLAATPIAFTEETLMHRKKWPAILAILIVVLAGGMGAYAYVTGYFVSLPSVATEAFQKARAATSGTSDTTISIDASNLSQGMTSIIQTEMDKGSLTIKGSYDISNKDAPQLGGTLSLDLGPINGDAEFRILNKTIYGQLTRVAPAVSMFVPTDGLLNTWFSLDSTSNNSGVAPIIPGMLPLSGFTSSPFTALTDSQKAGLEKITDDAHFITVVKKLDQEKINDVQSYHFTFDLDRPGITKYATDILAYIHTIGMNDSALSSFDSSEITKLLASVTAFSGEEWIGVKDHLPYKLSMSFSVSDDSNPSLGPVKVSFVSVLKDWNKPVTIEAPSGAIPFQTFINQATAAAVAQASDTRVMGTVSGSRAVAELYFSKAKSYKGFCKSRDAQDLLAGLTGAGFPATDITCKDATSSYVMAAKLTNGTLFCSDSTGASGVADVSKTGALCAVAQTLPTF